MSGKFAKGFDPRRGCGKKGRSGNMCGREWKTTPKASAKPSQADLYWIAGYLEGEGCFASDKPHSLITTVKVASTDIEPLQKLARFLGGSVHPHHRNGDYYKNRKPQFVWETTGARGRGVMMTVYSLMSPRRQGRIRAVIANSRRAAA